MGGGIHPERIGGELLMATRYILTYYRNHSASDTTTHADVQTTSAVFTLKSIDELGWEAPSGYTFKEWNTASDGSGVTRYPGNTTNSYTWYAIWETIPDPVPYIATDAELTAVADAIRTKGGTSAALEWPSGFAQAIADIPSGGGGGMLVTFTEANYTYTADKTFGEIAEALDAGIMPSVKFVPATSSDYPTYVGISWFSIENTSYYSMKLTAFHTSYISGSPSSYPSWSSDN